MIYVSTYTTDLLFYAHVGYVTAVNMVFQNTAQQASIDLSIKMYCANLINLLWIVDGNDTISSPVYLRAEVSIHVHEQINLQGKREIESNLTFIPVPNKRHSIYLKALYQADNDERKIYRSDPVTVKLLQSKYRSNIKLILTLNHACIQIS